MTTVEDTAQTMKRFLKTATFLGKGFAVRQVQSMLMPHILQIFNEHDHSELEKMVVTNYALIEEQTPQPVRNILDNLGSNPEMRAQWEGVVLELVTPENIKEWLRNPDEWLDAEEAEEQREELRKCAEVIEETPHGEQWLETQVLDLYRMAHIIPNNSKTVETNE